MESIHLKYLKLITNIKYYLNPSIKLSPVMVKGLPIKVNFITKKDMVLEYLKKMVFKYITAIGKMICLMVKVV